MYHVPTDTIKRYRSGIPTDNYGAVVIHTGLSVVTACGHRIDLVRDASAKVATVRVRQIACAALGADECNVTEAADMLAERARRFLGAGWTVVPWKPQEDHGRTADLREHGLGA